MKKIVFGLLAPMFAGLSGAQAEMNQNPVSVVNWAYYCKSPDDHFQVFVTDQRAQIISMPHLSTKKLDCKNETCQRVEEVGSRIENQEANEPVHAFETVDKKAKPKKPKIHKRTDLIFSGRTKDGGFKAAKQVLAIDGQPLDIKDFELVCVPLKVPDLIAE